MLTGAGGVTGSGVDDRVRTAVIPRPRLDLSSRQRPGTAEALALMDGFRPAALSIRATLRGADPHSAALIHRSGTEHHTSGSCVYDSVMGSARADRPLVFVSYAHEDKELCRRLVLMLGLVLGERGYGVWWDQTMVAGAWRDQIDGSLDRAVASLLLVSEYSLTSEFILDEELPRLLARGKVAPVYVRPCPWRSVPVIAGLQFLGSTEQALTERVGDLAAALTDLAQRAPDFLGLPTL